MAVRPLTDGQRAKVVQNGKDVLLGNDALPWKDMRPPKDAPSKAMMLQGR